MPTAGSIVSSLAKETWGWNQAQVTWTHNKSSSVGLRAPPKHTNEGKFWNQTVYNPYGGNMSNRELTN